MTTTRKTSKTTKSSVSNFHNFVSFSDIGGLSEHIRTLKELIIFPLVYQNVYEKFRIRPPRGVLFYGPPGTGKTLVAGAIAKECSKEINGKITFFSRKGADVLNKWVGESEEKLRALFAEAAECHPSIIFFDEIDGLAPIRSSKQDQVHASVVATLLALMDGLDKHQGVVIIGATNRIDAIDPALRRPGRFDRELYFPLPTYDARREILEVHVQSWTVQPRPSFISYLADITSGYSGSDIQALCSEAVMSCLRRNYPKIHCSKINIRTRTLKVSEDDFIQARSNIAPSTNRETNPMRRLSLSIQPLLQRQLNQVVLQLQTKSPHFTDSKYKYNMGSKRYAGRLLLIGNQNQGHNTHMAPALLHALEHLPSYIIDIQALYKCADSSAEEICVQKLTQAKMNLPSIVLAYRLDEWWDIVEESTRAIMVSMLKDINAGLPLLIIATATNDLPASLTTYFTEPNSIVHVMDDPDSDERGNYFHTLFMDNALLKCKAQMRQKEPINDIPVFFSEVCVPTRNRRFIKCSTASSNGRVRNIEQDSEIAGSSRSGVKRKGSFSEDDRSSKMRKCSDSNLLRKSSDCFQKPQSAWSPLLTFAKKIRESLTNISKQIEDETNIETRYLNKGFSVDQETPSGSTRRLTNNKSVRKSLKKPLKKNASANDSIIPGDSKVSHVQRIKYLFRRTVSVTTKNMAVAQLELLYDMLATCINRENQDVSTMLENIGSILTDFETNHAGAVVEF